MLCGISLPDDETLKERWDRFDSLVSEQVSRLRTAPAASSSSPSLATSPEVMTEDSMSELTSSAVRPLSLDRSARRRVNQPRAPPPNNDVLILSTKRYIESLDSTPFAERHANNSDATPLCGDISCGLPSMTRRVGPLLDLAVMNLESLQSVGCDVTQSGLKCQETQRSLKKLRRRSQTLEHQLRQFTKPVLVTSLSRRSARAAGEAGTMARLVDRLRRTSRKSALDPSLRQKASDMSLKLKALLSRQKCEWQCVGRLKETLTMAREIRDVLRFLTELSSLLHHEATAARWLQDRPPPYEFRDRGDQPKDQRPVYRPRDPDSDRHTDRQTDRHNASSSCHSDGTCCDSVSMETDDERSGNRSGANGKQYRARPEVRHSSSLRHSSPLRHSTRTRQSSLSSHSDSCSSSDFAFDWREEDAHRGQTEWMTCNKTQPRTSTSKAAIGQKVGVSLNKNAEIAEIGVACHTTPEVELSQGGGPEVEPSQCKQPEGGVSHKTSVHGDVTTELAPEVAGISRGGGDCNQHTEHTEHVEHSEHSKYSEHPEHPEHSEPSMHPPTPRTNTKTRHQSDRPMADGMHSRDQTKSQKKRSHRSQYKQSRYDQSQYDQSQYDQSQYDQSYHSQSQNDLSYRNTSQHDQSHSDQSQRDQKSEQNIKEQSHHSIHSNNSIHSNHQQDTSNMTNHLQDLSTVSHLDNRQQNTLTISHLDSLRSDVSTLCYHDNQQHVADIHNHDDHSADLSIPNTDRGALGLGKSLISQSLNDQSRQTKHDQSLQSLHSHIDEPTPDQSFHQSHQSYQSTNDQSHTQSRCDQSEDCQLSHQSNHTTPKSVHQSEPGGDVTSLTPDSGVGSPSSGSLEQTDIKQTLSREQTFVLDTVTKVTDKELSLTRENTFVLDPCSVKAQQVTGQQAKVTVKTLTRGQTFVIDTSCVTGQGAKVTGQTVKDTDTEIQHAIHNLNHTGSFCGTRHAGSPCSFCNTACTKANNRGNTSSAATVANVTGLSVHVNNINTLTNQGRTDNTGGTVNIDDTDSIHNLTNATADMTGKGLLAKHAAFNSPLTTAKESDSRHPVSKCHNLLTTAKESDSGHSDTNSQSRSLELRSCWQPLNLADFDLGDDTDLHDNIDPRAFKILDVMATKRHDTSKGHDTDSPCHTDSTCHNVASMAGELETHDQNALPHDQSVAPNDHSRAPNDHKVTQHDHSATPSDHSAAQVCHDVPTVDNKPDVDKRNSDLTSKNDDAYTTNHDGNGTGRLEISNSLLDQIIGDVDFEDGDGYSKDEEFDSKYADFKNEDMGSKSEHIETKSEDVESKSEDINSKDEDTDFKDEDIDSKEGDSGSKDVDSSDSWERAVVGWCADTADDGTDMSVSAATSELINAATIHTVNAAITETITASIDGAMTSEGVEAEVTSEGVEVEVTSEGVEVEVTSDGVEVEDAEMTSNAAVAGVNGDATGRESAEVHADTAHIHTADTLHTGHTHAGDTLHTTQAHGTDTAHTTNTHGADTAHTNAVADAADTADATVADSLCSDADSPSDVSFSRDEENNNNARVYQDRRWGKGQGQINRQVKGQVVTPSVGNTKLTGSGTGRPMRDGPDRKATKPSVTASTDRKMNKTSVDKQTEQKSLETAVTNTANRNTNKSSSADLTDGKTNKTPVVDSTDQKPKFKIINLRDRKPNKKDGIDSTEEKEKSNKNKVADSSEETTGKNNVVGAEDGQANSPRFDSDGLVNSPRFESTGLANSSTSRTGGADDTADADVKEHADARATTLTAGINLDIPPYKHVTSQLDGLDPTPPITTGDAHLTSLPLVVPSDPNDLYSPCDPHNFCMTSRNDVTDAASASNVVLKSLPTSPTLSPAVLCPVESSYPCVIQEPPTFTPRSIMPPLDTDQTLHSWRAPPPPGGQYSRHYWSEVKAKGKDNNVIRSKAASHWLTYLMVGGATAGLANAVSSLYYWLTYDPSEEILHVIDNFEEFDLWRV